ncbi:MAG: MFS transporter [Austwickia sp.]|nr:MAG: MFS transporter [Austwickia sp.]
MSPLPTAGAWAVLRDPRFARYFTARLVATFGSSMAPIAVAFAALHIDPAPGGLALVIGTHTGAQILCLLFGGVVADRWPRVRVLQGAHVVTALTQGVAAALVLSGRADIPTLAVIEAVNGAASGFAVPAMTGIVPSVVDRDRLQEANSLLALARGTLRVLGPAFGGALVATVGPGWALATDAVTYTVAVLVLAGLRLPRGAVESPAGFVRELAEGWTEFRSRQWVWVIVATFGVINAIGVGVVGVLGPLIAVRTPELGEAGWGLALAADAAGGVVMTLVMMRLRVRRPLLVGQLAVAWMAAPMVLLGVAPAVLPLALAFALSGTVVQVFAIAWETALQEHVPQHVLSRVSAYDALGSFLGIPVGTFAFGWLATRFPPGQVAIAGGIAYAVVALAALLSPEVRQLRRA